jgi:predicted mannosyl-3-phosphoglycerate phosphatase (HAD superfamily)
MTNFLVFTDLDGTLLDHHSYSCEEAMPAVRALAEAGFPLIFNSSKTAAEIKKRLPFQGLLPKNHFSHNLSFLTRLRTV